MPFSSFFFNQIPKGLIRFTVLEIFSQKCGKTYAWIHQFCKQEAKKSKYIFICTDSVCIHNKLWRNCIIMLQYSFIMFLTSSVLSFKSPRCSWPPLFWLNNRKPFPGAEDLVGSPSAICSRTPTPYSRYSVFPGPRAYCLSARPSSCASPTWCHPSFSVPQNSHSTWCGLLLLLCQLLQLAHFSLFPFLTVDLLFDPNPTYYSPYYPVTQAWLRY